MKTKKLLLVWVMASFAMTGFAGTPPVINIDCDSMITNLSGRKKEVYERDVQGKLIYATVYSGTEDNGWNEYYRTKYGYDDALGIINSEIYSEWNNETDSWEVWSKSEYEHDTYGNQTVMTFYRFIGGWQLFFGTKYEYEYANGKVTSRICLWWNDEDNKWGSSYDEKIEYEYDAQGNLVKESTYNRSGQKDWQPTVPVFTYEYDAQNREIIRIYYNSCRTTTLPEGYAMELLAGYKYKTEYNAQGGKESETQYKMEKSQNNWTETLYEKHEYESDAQGKEITDSYSETIQIFLDSYTKNSTKINIYFAPDRLFETSHISSIRDSRGRVSKQTQIDYRYSLQGYSLPNDLYNISLPANPPSSLPVYWKPLVENFTILSTPTEYTTQWYYSGETSIMTPDLPAQISIYPTLATDRITVSGLQSGETLYIYNIHGNILFYREATGETEEIAVSHWPVGVYFVKTGKGQVLKWVKG